LTRSSSGCAWRGPKAAGLTAGGIKNSPEQVAVDDRLCDPSENAERYDNADDHKNNRECDIT
jgi:hypothetical protein